MKNAKRFAAALLAGAMAFTMLTPQSAFAAKKKKVTYVTRAYALRQIENKLGATVQAEDMSMVKDKKVSKADQKTMAVAVNAGLVTPNASGKLSPKTKATYSYVAGVLANVEQKDKKTISKNKSTKKLTKTTLNSYLKSQFPNVISKDNAKIKKGNVIVNKPLTIKDKTIKGDLIIGDGVADKEVTLDNVTVQGKMVVRGGGENSVIIKGNSKVSRIDVKQVNNRVSIKVQGGADVSMIFVNDGSHDVNIVGSVGELTVDGSDIGVSLTGATVGKVTIAENAQGATVTADKDSTVTSVELNAENSKVEGDGKVEAVNVNANGTTVTVRDTKITTKDGVTAPKTDTDTKPATPATPVAPAPAGPSTAPSSGPSTAPTGPSDKPAVITDPRDVTYIGEYEETDNLLPIGETGYLNKAGNQITLAYFMENGKETKLDTKAFTLVQQPNNKEKSSTNLSDSITSVDINENVGKDYYTTYVILSLNKSLETSDDYHYLLSYDSNVSSFTSRNGASVKSFANIYVFKTEGRGRSFQTGAVKSDDGKYFVVRTPISVARSGIDESQIRVVDSETGEDLGLEADDFAFDFVDLMSQNYSKKVPEKVSVKLPDGVKAVDIAGDPVTGLDNIPVLTQDPVKFGNSAIYYQYNKYDKDDNVIGKTGQLSIALDGKDVDLVRYGYGYRHNFSFKFGDKSIVLSNEDSVSYEEHYDGKAYIDIVSDKFEEYGISSATSLTFEYSPKMDEDNYYMNLMDASGRLVPATDGFVTVPLTVIGAGEPELQYNSDSRIKSVDIESTRATDNTRDDNYTSSVNFRVQLAQPVTSASIYYVVCPYSNDTEATTEWVKEGKYGYLDSGYLDGTFKADSDEDFEANGVVKADANGEAVINVPLHFNKWTDEEGKVHENPIVDRTAIYLVVDDGQGNVSATPTRQIYSWNELEETIKKSIDIDTSLSVSTDNKTIRAYFNLDTYLDKAKSVVDKDDFKLMYKTESSDEEKYADVKSVNIVNTDKTGYTKDKQDQWLSFADYIEITSDDDALKDASTLYINYEPKKGNAIVDKYGTPLAVNGDDGYVDINYIASEDKEK